MDIFNQINFEDPNKSNAVIKATVHKTGRLGFSSGAQSFMNLNESSYFKIGFNDSDPNDTNIYMVRGAENDNAFKIAKAGDYYFVGLKYIFDKREIDYQNESIIYDIKKQTNNNIEYFILSKRK